MNQKPPVDSKVNWIWDPHSTFIYTVNRLSRPRVKGKTDSGRNNVSFLKCTETQLRYSVLKDAHCIGLPHETCGHQGGGFKYQRYALINPATMCECHYRSDPLFACFIHDVRPAIGLNISSLPNEDSTRLYLGIGRDWQNND